MIYSIDLLTVKKFFYVLCEKEGFFQAFTSLFGKTLCESWTLKLSGLGVIQKLRKIKVFIYFIICLVFSMKKPQYRILFSKCAFHNYSKMEVKRPWNFVNVTIHTGFTPGHIASCDLIFCRNLILILKKLNKNMQNWPMIRIKLIKSLINK